MSATLSPHSSSSPTHGCPGSLVQSQPRLWFARELQKTTKHQTYKIKYKIIAKSNFPISSLSVVIQPTNLALTSHFFFSLPLSAMVDAFLPGVDISIGDLLISALLECQVD
jgi:hypothetical protein